FALGQWVGSFLDMTGGDWPPERPGVYVVSLEKWQRCPSEQEKILYVGCSQNLLERIGDLVQVLLGFYNSPEGPKEVGRHTGWKIREYSCNKPHIRQYKVANLFLGWAATSVPCHSCVETDLVSILKPDKECQAGYSRPPCYCPVNATA